MFLSSSGSSSPKKIRPLPFPKNTGTSPVAPLAQAADSARINVHSPFAAASKAACDGFKSCAPDALAANSPSGPAQNARGGTPLFAATEQSDARSYSGGPQARCSSRLRNRSAGAMISADGCRPPTRVSAKDGSSGGAACAATTPTAHSSRAASDRHHSPSHDFLLAAMSSESWPDGRLREEDGSSRPHGSRRALLWSAPLHVSGRGGLAAVGVKRSAPPLTAPRTAIVHAGRRPTHGRPHAVRRDDGRAQRPAGRPLARRTAWDGGNPRCGRRCSHGGRCGAGT